MKQKSILVISEGAPPIGDNLVEGGGLRCWGLASGFAKNGLKVTLAYQDVYKVKNVRAEAIPSNISIKTWNEKNIGTLISEHEILVFSYAMGQAPLFIQKIADDHIVVLDCYVPIAIEVAARNSSDMKLEFQNYTHGLKEWKHVARRGDYFLCASEQQFNYYLGYLAAINRINPLTYKDVEERLLIVPYGLHASDVLERKLPVAPTLLWYGGFYPWFDIETLATTLFEVKKRIPNFKFLVAGAKNPYNKNKDFVSYYHKSVKSLEKLGESVEYIEWLPFADRLETYAKASAIITVNHLGVENRLAWRTRLMDFVTAKRPILTNGGDPLAEDLIRRNIARRVNLGDVETIVKILANPGKFVNNSDYNDAIADYDWKNVTLCMVSIAATASRLRQPYFEPRVSIRGKVGVLVGYPMRIVRFVRTNGAKSAVSKVKSKLKN